MRTVQCNSHQVLFRLPTSDEEFISGSFHKDVERIQIHVLENIDCKIEEVPDGKRVDENSSQIVRD